MSNDTPLTDFRMISVIPNIIDSPDAFYAVPADVAREMERRHNSATKYIIELHGELGAAEARVVDIEQKLNTALSELSLYKQLAAEGRRAGREEALAIIMDEDAEDPFDDERENYSIGCTGDYGVKWNEEALRDKLDIETPGTMTSLLDRSEAIYWEYVGEQDNVEFSGQRALDDLNAGRTVVIPKTEAHARAMIAVALHAFPYINKDQP